jgi:hypothetical protein
MDHPVFPCIGQEPPSVVITEGIPEEMGFQAQARAMAYDFGQLSRQDLLMFLLFILALSSMYRVLAFMLAPVINGLYFILRINYSALRYGWIQLTWKPTVAPAQKTIEFLRLSGDLRIRQVGSEMGLFCETVVNGRVIPVLINPNWQSHLGATLSTATQVQEAIIPCSIINEVPIGRERKSLVMIQDSNGTNLGVGVRTKCGNSDVLLTCAHALRNIRSTTPGELYIAKHNKQGVLMRFEITKEVEAELACPDPDIDVIALRVESCIWSKLGVGSAKVIKAAKRNTPVTLFGVAGGEWVSSSGLALQGTIPGSFEHTASTQPGWSGSPLFTSDGQFIGLHRGVQVANQSNVATILWPFFNTEESSDNSGVFKEVTDPTELDHPARNTRSVRVLGRGTYKYTDTEYARPSKTAREVEDKLRESGKMLWADIVDDYFDAKYDEVEACDPLNCQRGSGTNQIPTTHVPTEEVPASSVELPPVVRTPSLGTSGHSPDIVISTPAPVRDEMPSAPPVALMPEESPVALGKKPMEQQPAMEEKLAPLQEKVGDMEWDLNNIGARVKEVALQQELASTKLAAQMAAQLKEAMADMKTLFLKELECHSLKLASRVSDLERAPCQQDQPRSRSRQRNSPNSGSSRGPSADQTRSSRPSSSRQENIKSPNLQATSSKHATDSLIDTRRYRPIQT